MHLPQVLMMSVLELEREGESQYTDHSKLLGERLHVTGAGFTKPFSDIFAPQGTVLQSGWLSTTIPTPKASAWRDDCRVIGVNVWINVVRLCRPRLRSLRSTHVWRAAEGRD